MLKGKNVSFEVLSSSFSVLGLSPKKLKEEQVQTSGL